MNGNTKSTREEENESIQMKGRMRYNEDDWARLSVKDRIKAMKWDVYTSSTSSTEISSNSSDISPSHVFAKMSIKEKVNHLNARNVNAASTPSVSTPKTTKETDETQESSVMITPSPEPNNDLMDEILSVSSDPIQSSLENTRQLPPQLSEVDSKRQQIENEEYDSVLQGEQPTSKRSKLAKMMDLRAKYKQKKQTTVSPHREDLNDKNKSNKPVLNKISVSPHRRRTLFQSAITKQHQKRIESTSPIPASNAGDTHKPASDTFQSSSSVEIKDTASPTSSLHPITQTLPQTHPQLYQHHPQHYRQKPQQSYTDFQPHHYRPISPPCPISPPSVVRSSKRNIIIDNEQISPFPTQICHQPIIPSSSPPHSKQSRYYEGRPQIPSYTFQDKNNALTSPKRSYHDEFYNASSFRAVLETFSNDSADTARVSNVSASTINNSDFKSRLKSGVYAKRSRDLKHCPKAISHLEKKRDDCAAKSEGSTNYQDKKSMKENMVSLKPVESKHNGYEGSCAGHLLSMMEGVCGLGIASTSTKDDFNVEMCGKVMHSKVSSDEDLSEKKKRKKKKRFEQPKSVSRNSSMIERGRSRFRDGPVRI